MGSFESENGESKYFVVMSDRIFPWLIPQGEDGSKIDSITGVGESGKAAI